MTAPVLEDPGGEAATTVRQCLARTRARLGGDVAHLEAQLLVCRALVKPRSWLFAHGETTLQPGQCQALERLAARRESGEPMAYVLGHREFWDMDLTVTPAVLIPRPDTERLVEAALAHLQDIARPHVLELGTGSGAIAIAIARARPDARVLATDASPAALAVARENIRRLAPGRVALHRGNWFQGLEDCRFQMVLANPPYVACGDPHLHTGDLRFEPRQALVSGPCGLEALRAIVERVRAHLCPGARVLLEHGFEQGEAVRGLLAGAGLGEVRTLRDLSGHERVTSACEVRDPAASTID